MPTCPGCNERVPHVKLPVHERFCEAVVGAAPNDVSTYEYFDARIRDVERRLDAYLAVLEAEAMSGTSDDKLLPLD